MRDSHHSPVGMFVVVSAVPDSVDMGWNFQKERQEGKRKWCTPLWWNVLEQELIMVWLTSVFCRFGLAGFEGTGRCWICSRHFKILFQVQCYSCKSLLVHVMQKQELSLSLWSMFYYTEDSDLYFTVGGGIHWKFIHLEKMLQNRKCIQTYTYSMLAICIIRYLLINSNHLPSKWSSAFRM